MTFLVVLVGGLLAAGYLSDFIIEEYSALLCLLLALDFITHYRKQMGVEDDFWESIVA
jgi:hypothetical protein